MGIEHSTAVGFTITALSEEVMEKVAQDNDCRFVDDFLDKKKLKYQYYGCCLVGPTTLALTFEIETAFGIEKDVSLWLDRVNEVFETSFGLKDVTFLNELYTY